MLVLVSDACLNEVTVTFDARSRRRADESDVQMPPRVLEPMSGAWRRVKISIGPDANRDLGKSFQFSSNASYAKLRL